MIQNTNLTLDNFSYSLKFFKNQPKELIQYLEVMDKDYEHQTKEKMIYIGRLFNLLIDKDLQVERIQNIFLNFAMYQCKQAPIQYSISIIKEYQSSQSILKEIHLYCFHQTIQKVDTFYRELTSPNINKEKIEWYKTIFNLMEPELWRNNGYIINMFLIMIQESSILGINDTFHYIITLPYEKNSFQINYKKVAMKIFMDTALRKNYENAAMTCFRTLKKGESLVFSKDILMANLAFTCFKINRESFGKFAYNAIEDVTLKNKIMKSQNEPVTSYTWIDHTP